MQINQIITGDALAELHKMPEGFVQTCITSPPYYNLRDYGIEGQIGLEESPEEFVDKLVQVFREVRRVLRDDGTCWINLGDSYAGGGRGGQTEKMLSENWQPNYPRSTVPDRCKPKDLIGIPWMVAFALRADGWYLRSDIIWHKPTAMPESVTDRPTKVHEYLFLFAKSEGYYYDADAIREPHKAESIERTKHSWNGNRERGSPQGPQTLDFSLMCHPNGRNKRTVWTINTQPYSEAHFATFPPKLVEPCILAGSRPGDIVLDCFSGAGTVALVAIQHGRNYLGIELNSKYTKMAEKRIAHVQQNLWSLGEEIAV